jgi:Fe-S cluster biosynthesis and repair protein YggX
MSEITCTRCNESGPQLKRQPFRNEIGERIHKTICQNCWNQWLGQQTALINHYGLDVRDQPAREMLLGNMEAFLFKTGEGDGIDTSKQGTVSW